MWGVNTNYAYLCQKDLGPTVPSLDLGRVTSFFFFTIGKITIFGVGHRVGHRVGHGLAQVLYTPDHMLEKYWIRWKSKVKSRHFSYMVRTCCDWSGSKSYHDMQHSLMSFTPSFITHKQVFSLSIWKGRKDGATTPSNWVLKNHPPDTCYATKVQKRNPLPW